MATRTIVERTCDAYGTKRDVELYRVTLERIDDDGKPKLIDGVAFKQESVADLSYRGRTRLEHFIQKGVSTQTREKPETS